MKYYDKINLFEMIGDSLVSLGMTSNVANASMLQYIKDSIDKSLGGTEFLREELKFENIDYLEGLEMKFTYPYTQNINSIIVRRKEDGLIVSMELNGEYHIVETNNRNHIAIDQTDLDTYERIKIGYNREDLDYIKLTTIDMGESEERTSTIRPLNIKHDRTEYLSYTTKNSSNKLFDILRNNKGTYEKVLAFNLYSREDSLKDYIPELIETQKQKMASEVISEKIKDRHR